jgi:hypothetical protein
MGAAVTSGATASVTYSATPVSGNTLLVFVAWQGDLTFTDPAGWDRLINYYSTLGGAHLCILGKQSAGSEGTVSVTLSGSASNLRMQAQEWAGVPYSTSTMIYSAGSQPLNGFFTTAVTWDPAAATTDRARSVYLFALGLSAGFGSVSSDWANADVTYNLGIFLLGHKIVGDGSSVDTAVTWANSRAIAGGVFTLRGTP